MTVFNKLRDVLVCIVKRTLIGLALVINYLYIKPNIVSRAGLKP